MIASIHNSESQQLTLAGIFQSPVGVAPSTSTWEKFGGTGKLHAEYLHAQSGWRVRHCGHPTALWPYYLITAQNTRRLAPNGRGFMRLDLAKQYVEDMWAGKLGRTSGEDFRVYQIIRSEKPKRGVKPLETVVDRITGFVTADRRREVLQDEENALHPQRSSWCRTLFTLALDDGDETTCVGTEAKNLVSAKVQPIAADSREGVLVS